MHIVIFSYQKKCQAIPLKRFLQIHQGARSEKKISNSVLPFVSHETCLAWPDESSVTNIHYVLQTIHLWTSRCNTSEFKGKQLVQFGSEGGQILTCRREAYPHIHGNTNANNSTHRLKWSFPSLQQHVKIQKKKKVNNEHKSTRSVTDSRGLD